jgi:hypothetical protein
MKLIAPTDEQIELARQLEREFMQECKLYQDKYLSTDACCAACPYGRYVGSCFPMYLIQKFASQSNVQEILKELRSRARMMYDSQASIGIHAIDVQLIDQLLEGKKDDRIQ